MSSIEVSAEAPEGALIFSIKDVATLLIKDQKIHEGFFDTVVEFQVGFGAVGPDPDSTVPGAVIGVSKIGIKPVAEPGKASIDASLVNPAKPRQPRKK